MQPNASCQPNETEIFSTANIRQCKRYIRSIQRKLDKAVASGDKTKIRWYCHILSKRSRAVKILAVHRITKLNAGRFTAGIDGIAIPKGSNKAAQDKWRHKRLAEIDVYKTPAPIRRVFIPKSNGKLRPLGILTIADRIVQDILRQALEPIAEYHFSTRSYGFRPKRCAQDAIEDLFGKLSRKGSRRWIVEGDISGCFNHISHCHIIKTLRDWHTPIWAIDVIHKMLKAKIFYNGQAFPSNEGTQQGGPISPILANVALTALDEYCEKFGWNAVSPITRFADDFVVVCKSEKEAEFIKKEISIFLKQEIGLDLSDEKTQITHITKGFDFLGFNIRKYKTRDLKSKKSKWDDYQLIIKPQKEKVARFLDNCRKELKSQKTITQDAMVAILNRKLMGWGNYYRFVCSKETFNRIDHEIWWKCYRWAKRRHPNKSAGWVINKYFFRKGNRKDKFHDKESNTFLFIMSSISCARRWIKVRREYRVHDGRKEAIEYWQNREYMNAKDSIYGSGALTQLFRGQKGKCAYCKTPITPKAVKNGDIHRHHMKPRTFSGDEKLRNLRLLHGECHRDLHADFTREEMAKYDNSGIDYLRLLKRKRSPE